MSNKPTIVEEWIQKGENDLKNSKVLLQEGGTVDAICFHSQQAVEKYLKAILAFNYVPVRKIHSLVALAKQGAQKEPALLEHMKSYKILEAYYIESRYPPETRVYEQEEGETAYNLANEIISSIKHLLKKPIRPRKS